MATNQTPNYGLNQWVPTDQVIHSEFNADNLKIDQTLKSLSDQITQNKQEGSQKLEEEVEQVESALTTKINQVQSNLTQAQSSLNQKITQTQTNLTNAQSTLTKKIDQNKTELTQKITKTNSDLTTKINTVEDRLEQQIGTKGNCLMVTGSYKGTGTYGNKNPTRLSFSRPPKMVLVAGNFFQLTLVSSVSACYPHGLNYNSTEVTVAWKGNTVEFYSSSTPVYQLNQEGETYYYFAILASS